MNPGIIPVGESFWNIRDSFKIAGAVDIGTQASLVQLGSGNFVFLDSCSLSTESKIKIDKLTDGGKKVEAIINLHPFHTLKVSEMHSYYPGALLYGTSRHREVLPELPWEELCSEDKALHALYADDLAFSVPEGVHFYTDNQQIHFSSVLSYHAVSKTIHVDDTLMFTPYPRVLSALGFKDRLSLHPTLPFALEKNKKSADQFRRWGQSLVSEWEDATNLCAAHTAPLLNEKDLADRILKALKNVEWVLKFHQLRYGLS